MAITQTFESPLLQKYGNEVIQIMVETIAKQVKMKASNGTTDSNVQAEIEALRSRATALEATVASKESAIIVADIAARDALASPSTGNLVWVLDASDDDTVTAGAALYLYNAHADSNPAVDPEWYKLTEVESLDVVLKWADLQNKPESAVADIDDAVEKKHEHENKAVLDNLTFEDGKLHYNGKQVGGAAYVTKDPSDPDFADAVSALNLADGQFFTVIA